MSRSATRRVAQEPPGSHPPPRRVTQEQPARDPATRRVAHEQPAGHPPLRRVAQERPASEPATRRLAQEQHASHPASRQVAPEPPAGDPAPRFTALEVPVSAVAPDPQQPRGAPGDAGLAALAASLRARGVIQPLVVRRHPSSAARAATPYMIIAGERRWAAARLAGLETVPVVVREQELSAADRLMMQLEENDGELRKSLSLYERARGVARAWRLSGLGKQEFARRHQRSAAWLSAYLKLAGAQGALGAALAEGHLAGMLAAMLFERLTAEEQQALLARARRDHLAITPQQVETLARRRERLDSDGAAGADGTHLAAAAGPGVAGGSSSAGAIATGEARGSGSPAPPGPGEHRGGDSTALAATGDGGGSSSEGASGPREADGEGSADAVSPRDAGGGAAGIIVIRLTPRQLETLILLLGQEPLDSPEEMVEQLYSFLS